MWPPQRRSKESDNERLARQLEKCASMIRSGERGPLVESVIEELLEYNSSEAPPPPDNANSTHRPRKQQWCEEHFCVGCRCDTSPKVTLSSAATPHPAFKRPRNPSSSIVAAGWIEQRQRIKGQEVWKQILASVVEGQKSGEETTLYIYQEGRAGELQVTHRIPVQFFKGVVMLDGSAGCFALEISHFEDKFVFHCSDNSEAAQEWVATLKSVMDMAQENRDDGFQEEKKTEHVSWAEDAAAETQIASPQKARLSISELRSIAHGAGITTVGMERKDLEKAVADLRARAPPPPPVPPRAHTATTATENIRQTVPSSEPAPSTSTTEHVDSSAHPTYFPSGTDAERKTPPREPIPFSRMTIKDLRAIAHGVGISTVGMERQELEKAVAEAYGCPDPNDPVSTRPRSRDDENTNPTGSAASNTGPAPYTSSPPPTSGSGPQTRPPSSAQSAAKPRMTVKELRSVAHGVGINPFGMERHELEVAISNAYNKIAENAKKAQSSADLHGKVATQQDRPTPDHPKAKEETNQQRQREEADAAFREFPAEVGKEREEEERKRKQEEGRMQKEEKEYMNVQADLFRRQEEEKMAAEPKAAQEEQQNANAHPHYRGQQKFPNVQSANAYPSYQGQQQFPNMPSHGQYNQQQNPNQQWNAPQNAAFHQQQNFAQQNQYWYQGQHNQHNSYPWQHPTSQSTPHFTGAPGPTQPPQPQPQAPSSPPANSSEEAMQAREKSIKQGVLIEWALQPPMLQSLRPITALLSTIHTVFPPKFGIAEHAHFRKWRIIQVSDLCGPDGQPVDAKLEKARRRLSLVLHEDKYPSDFSNEHKVLCKLLWAVINDAFDAAAK